MSKLFKTSIPNKIKLLLDKSAEPVQTNTMEAWQAYKKKIGELDALEKLFSKKTA